jgi:hypothetical protein
MDMITQDLETAVFRNNGQQWLRVDAPLLSGGDYAGQTVGLKLFSPALDRPSGPGDICAIGYRLSYKKSYAGATSPVYALYRRIVAPDETFNQYLGSGDPSASPQGSLAEPGQNGANWTDNSLVADENYLVSNIVGFKILIYELDTTTNPALPVADLVNADADGELDAHYAYGGAVEANVMSTNKLLYADVILTVVSDAGLEMLDNIDKLPEDADEVVALHGETFVRRVNFMAHPL